MKYKLIYVIIFLITYQLVMYIHVKEQYCVMNNEKMSVLSFSFDVINCLPLILII